MKIEVSQQDKLEISDLLVKATGLPRMSTSGYGT